MVTRKSVSISKHWIAVPSFLVRTLGRFGWPVFSRTPTIGRWKRDRLPPPTGWRLARCENGARLFARLGIECNKLGWVRGVLPLCEDFAVGTKIDARITGCPQGAAGMIQPGEELGCQVEEIQLVNRLRDLNQEESAPVGRPIHRDDVAGQVGKIHISPVRGFQTKGRRTPLLLVVPVTRQSPGRGANLTTLRLASSPSQSSPRSAPLAVSKANKLKRRTVERSVVATMATAPSKEKTGPAALLRLWNNRRLGPSSLPGRASWR